MRVCWQLCTALEPGPLRLCNLSLHPHSITRNLPALSCLSLPSACGRCSYSAPRSAKKKRVFTSLTELMQQEQAQRQQQGVEAVGDASQQQQQQQQQQQEPLQQPQAAAGP